VMVNGPFASDEKGNKKFCDGFYNEKITQKKDHQWLIVFSTHSQKLG